MNHGWNANLTMLLGLLLAGLLPGVGEAARQADVRATKHNLSVNNYAGGPTRTVKATTESQVCVFCHTPHGATQQSGVKSPLWNRQLSTATYTGYSSSSIQADVSQLATGPGGTSKLCLSCHDGTLAIGSVNVLGGIQSASINMTGTGGGGVMPAGSGATTGFTRNLGVDLSNDHPVSFDYTTTVATADGELRSPPYTNAGATLVMSNRDASNKPKLPLDADKLQCSTCHDPHIKDTAETAPIKFLRLNRFQKNNAPSGTDFNVTNDIICLACHDKKGTSWSTSVHASTTAAEEVYKSGVGSPAELREFPTSVKVWEAACLNCHDTHTVAGSRRLLREGTDNTSTPKAGGKAAIEETCYQCHTTTGSSILDNATAVPDIKSDFTSTRRMPITTADQTNSPNKELHDITNADLQETQLLLGKGNLDNRHVECTDCHNPHRVLKNRLFNGTGATTAATHLHDASTQHSNIISGALRGQWGVEPTFGTTTWMALPTAYTVKKGEPSTDTARSNTYLTREYQICLKCHSDYGYDDNNTYPTGNRPTLGSFNNGTPTNTNGLTQYTNQAMEFNAAANDALTGTDQGEATAVHRSWHPVIYPTGRTLAIRSMSNAGWYAPWNGSSGSYIGNQTIYCSDCHGSNTAANTSSPSTGKAWGPHGSENDFILKGTWDVNSGEGQSTTLCFRCHNPTSGNSGFCCGGKDNLHAYHQEKAALKCSRCHAAVPHGWKNKALLVDLNSVGPEAGQTEGTVISGSSYTQAPYYMGARLRVKTWRTSGNWSDSNCGPLSGTAGKDWMRSNCP